MAKKWSANVPPPPTKWWRIRSVSGGCFKSGCSFSFLIFPVLDKGRIYVYNNELCCCCLMISSWWALLLCACCGGKKKKIRRNLTCGVHAGVLCLFVPFFLSVGSPQSRIRLLLLLCVVPHRMNVIFISFDLHFPRLSCCWRFRMENVFIIILFPCQDIRRNGIKIIKKKTRKKGWEGVSVQLCACSCADECWVSNSTAGHCK